MVLPIGQEGSISAEELHLSGPAGLANVVSAWETFGREGADWLPAVERHLCITIWGVEL